MALVIIVEDDKYAAEVIELDDVRRYPSISTGTSTSSTVERLVSRLDNGEGTPVDHITTLIREENAKNNEPK